MHERIVEITAKILEYYEKSWVAPEKLYMNFLQQKWSCIYWTKTVDSNFFLIIDIDSSVNPLTWLIFKDFKIFSGFLDRLIC
jgi:hypothetical protein